MRVKATQTSYIEVDVSKKELKKHVLSLFDKRYGKGDINKRYHSEYYINKSGFVCYTEYSHHNGDPDECVVRKATQEDMSAALCLSYIEEIFNGAE